MNYVIFNKDGSLFYKSITEIINQNSDGVNKFFVSIIGYDVSTWGCSAVFRLPNGTSSEKSASTTATTEEVNGVSYTGYVITLSAIETTYAGNLLMSIMCYNSTTKGTLWTYPVYLTVNETVIDSEAPITNAEYATLITEMAGKLPKSGGSANPMTGDLYLGGHSIYGADEIVVKSLTATEILKNGKAVATEEYVGNNFVKKSGDTMSGTLDMSGNNVSNVGTLKVDDISTYTASLVSFAEGLSAPTVITPLLQSDTDNGEIISHNDINLNTHNLKNVANLYVSQIHETGTPLWVYSNLVFIPTGSLQLNNGKITAPTVEATTITGTNITKGGVDVATVDDLKTVKQNAFKVVDTLPTTGEEGVVYLLKDGTTYAKWIWEPDNPDKYINIGDTDIILSDYQKKLTAGDNITIVDNVISTPDSVKDVTLDGASIVDNQIAKIETGASAEAEAQEITLGSGLRLVNNVLSATGGGSSDWELLEEKVPQAPGVIYITFTGIESHKKLKIWGSEVISSSSTHLGSINIRSTDGRWTNILSSFYVFYTTMYLEIEIIEDGELEITYFGSDGESLTKKLVTYSGEINEIRFTPEDSFTDGTDIKLYAKD